MIFYSRKLRALAPMLVILAATSVFSQERREIPEYRVFGTPSTTADEAQIDQLIGEYKAAWTDQDTARFITLHADDVEWINAYARMFRGTESLSSFLEDRLFPAFDSDVSKEEIRNMKAVSTRFIGDSAAVIHMYTDGHRGASRVAGEEFRRTHLHLVLAKQSTGWKIVHTAIMDAR